MAKTASHFMLLVRSLEPIQLLGSMLFSFIKICSQNDTLQSFRLSYSIWKSSQAGCSGRDCPMFTASFSSFQKNTLCLKRVTAERFVSEIPSYRPLFDKLSVQIHQLLGGYT
jgi:hypothetical protein